MIEYSKELNEDQLRAVEAEDGPFLVIAGAGSGKTRVLVYRVARLVEKGIEPASILLLTFTRKASREMMSRAVGLLDTRCAKIAGGTFHSFANRILRKYAKIIGFESNFTILDIDDAASIIGLIRSKMGFDKAKDRFPKKDTIYRITSKAINTGWSIEDILYDEYPQFTDHIDDICEIEEGFRKHKKDKNQMDYDDLLIHLRDLLISSDEVRKKISNRYRYIMVDEYQDTNKLQGHITALLASEHQNIMVVGDDAQSIYSFRGAHFRNIMDFPDIFQGAEVITLTQNYRSVQAILDLTNGIIRNASEKFSKDLFTEKEGKNKPVFVNTDDDEGQAEFICDKILELREDDVPLDRIAVLFRNSFHSNAIEIELGNRGIPYVKFGGVKFLEAAHVKDVISFLRTLFNKNDDIAWNRILVMIPGVGGKTADRIIQGILNSQGGIETIDMKSLTGKKFTRDLFGLRNLYETIDPNQMSVDEIIQYFVSGWETHFTRKYDDFRSRREDLNSLMNIAEGYDSLETFLTNMTLEPPERTDVDQKDTEEEKLILSTIHSAKGLEFNTVFIISLLEGFLPDKRCMEKKSQIEEERRLFYVAATRAEENLFLLKPSNMKRAFNYYSGPAFTTILQPSRFLMEIEGIEDLVEAQEFTKTSYSDEACGYESDWEAPEGYSDEILKRIKRYYD